MGSAGAEVGKPVAPQTASVGVSTSKFVRNEGQVIRHNMVDSGRARMAHPRRPALLLPAAGTDALGQVLPSIRKEVIERSLYVGGRDHPSLTRGSDDLLRTTICQWEPGL